MKSLQLSVFSFAVALLAGPSSIAQKTEAKGVTRTSFNGWSDALVLESRAMLPRAVIVPAIGGRVMSYGVGDENILWGAAGEKETPGGFYCDVGPSLSDRAPHPKLTIGPYEWSAKKRYLVTLKSDKDESIHLEMEREVQLDPATGELGFVNRMKNIGELDSAYSLWHRIACRPGGFALLPLNKQSRFPAGWSERRDINGKPGYDGTQPISDAVKVIDGVLVAKTGGSEKTIGADANAQWVAYVLEKTLFIVHFPTYSSAVYAEGGNTVTISWNEQRTELQPFSPETRLRPRKSYDFPLKWALVTLPSEVRTPEEARALVEQIPGSPFL